MRRLAAKPSARSEPARGGTAAMSAGGQIGAVLDLQKSAGNQAVQALLRKKQQEPRIPIDERHPEGTTGPNPRPATSAPQGASTAAIDVDPKDFQWKDKTWVDGKNVSRSGRVGGIDRVLLENIGGNQTAQPERKKVKIDLRAGQFASSIGKGKENGKEGKRGRAVALVPSHLRDSPAGEIAIVVHLHGNDVKQSMLGSARLRDRGARPEDVGDFQIPQQMDEFFKQRPGARLLVLMPVGITLEGDNGAAAYFGIKDFDAFIKDCFTELGLDHGRRGDVYLSAHSGGGFTLSAMFASKKFPARFRGVFGFESYHGTDIRGKEPTGDIKKWKTVAKDRLERDLEALEAKRAEGTKDGDSADQIFRKQRDHLRNEGFRFTIFGGGARYGKGAREIRETILDWFANKQNSERLKKATGGRAEIINQLWLNYQARGFDENGHMTALSKDGRLLQTLLNLPDAGALASNAPQPGGGAKSQPP